MEVFINYDQRGSNSKLDTKICQVFGFSAYTNYKEHRENQPAPFTDTCKNFVPTKNIFLVCTDTRLTILHLFDLVLKDHLVGKMKSNSISLKLIGHLIRNQEFIAPGLL